MPSTSSKHYSGNIGTIITAVYTNIITRIDISFGVELFNGAEIVLTSGAITATGIGTAGLRIYDGKPGNWRVSIDFIRITTSGDYSPCMLAGDVA